MSTTRRPIRLLDARGNSLAPSSSSSSSSSSSPLARRLQARYDAASTDSENIKHWANADDLSASSANDPEVRRLLRRRSRYERNNNSYLDGMILTLANMLIGTGPRLQVRLPGMAQSKRITSAFEDWSKAVNLASKLHLYKQSASVDGEAFFLFSTNDRIDHDVKLDLLQIECDQVATPFEIPVNAYACDGIQFDSNWQPEYYHILRSHPGDTNWWTFPAEYDVVPARLVLHWFTQKRPRQMRGIPDVTSALALFAQLRRYTLAVIAAAETAADISAVLQSTLPPDEDFQEGEPFETIEIVKRFMMTVPAGYQLSQFKSEQPTTTYQMFKKEILEEIARCLNIPFAVASGNSADLNYASGRLDHQVFFTSLRVEQYDLECRVLDRIFAAWCAEARRVTDGLVPGGPTPKHEWFFDGHPHVDPLKEATATKIMLESGTTTYQAVYAAQGLDWREQLDAIAECMKYADKLGLDVLGAPEPEPEIVPMPSGGPRRPPGTPSKNGVKSSAGGERIHAAAPSGGEAMTFGATAEIQAASATRKRPTFDIKGYSGAPMTVAGHYHPIIIDLKGVKVPNPQIPALRSHDGDRVVGMTETIEITDHIRLIGTLTGENEDTRELLAHAANGYKWQASIGATVDERTFLAPGKTAEVNGRQVSGPLIIAKAVTLDEISFVSLGADKNNTSATLAASARNLLPPKERPDVDFEQWLNRKKFAGLAATGDAARTALRAMYDEDPTDNDKAPQAPSTAVATAPRVEGRKTLDQVVEEQRQEEARQDSITNLAAEAISERPAMTEQIRSMADAAIHSRAPADRFELEMMRLRVKVGNGPVRAQDRRSQAGLIECALARNGGLDVEDIYPEQVLEAADRAYPTGLGLVESLQLACHENGAGRVSARDVRGLLAGAFTPPRSDIQAFGFSTLGIPGILSNVANKSLVAGWDSVDTSWRAISARRSVRDFKAVTIYSLVGNFTYEEVGVTGEIKHKTLSELPYAARIKTFAAMLSITRQDIINDDLGALTQVPRQLGRGAALKLNDVFWSTFLNNASVFNTTNKNVLAAGAGSALSLTSLASAMTLFADQTGPDGEPLAATPRILLVPSSLLITAKQLMQSTYIAGNTTANTTQLAENVLAGTLTVVTSPYMSNAKYTGYSTTAWYVLASPSDIPVVEVQFLNGKQTPTLDQAEADFSHLGIQMRGVHDFGASLMEYRGGVRSPGV